jgi:type I restriction enzyme S subunit
MSHEGKVPASQGAEGLRACRQVSTRRPAGHRTRRCQCRRRRLDPKYLTHFLRQDRIRASGEKRMTGSAGQRRVPKMFLEELEIPLPPLDEQKRIAAILDQADELRRLRQRGIDRLNELGQAIFSETFAAESSGSQTWPERTISELADILVGFPFKSAHYIQSGRKIRLCRGANVLPGQIDWSDVAYLDEKRRSEFPLYELQSSDIVNRSSLDIQRVQGCTNHI